ncbi:hypothetical protein P3X46_028860 [Hevea brasiliensis]|uniref:Translation initiation factor eIF2B subunit gamma n=1 Tax=Hevea brasiliensis TaxID=3981 RepID=A0ABQ9KQE3_HEVBR|nr:hypothetical protein P3X46_028860 [Hevea brasiliensis]
MLAIVAAVPDDVGTGGALWAIAHHLTAKDILVVTGDLLSDVPPGAVVAAHRRHDAVMTTMLCSAPVGGPSESGSAAGKGAEVEKDIRIQKSILRAVGQMGMYLENLLASYSNLLFKYFSLDGIPSDLMDAYMYAFKRPVLQEVLDEKDRFQSLKQDVLPYLITDITEWHATSRKKNGNEKVASKKNQVVVSQILANASTPGFHKLYALGHSGSASVRQAHKCCPYIASNSKYCARLNSIQAFSDVIGEANHLSGYSFSAHNNIIHPSAQLGSKTTVGPHRMLGEGSQMGDKCTVKRSVVGRHCRIRSNVKVVNSVIMNHVTIGDGSSIQGCINVQLQERAGLKDCQVGAGFVVAAGCEYKGDPWPEKRTKSRNANLRDSSQFCTMRLHRSWQNFQEVIVCYH